MLLLPSHSASNHSQFCCNMNGQCQLDRQHLVGNTLATSVVVPTSCHPLSPPLCAISTLIIMCINYTVKCFCVIYTQCFICAYFSLIIGERRFAYEVR